MEYEKSVFSKTGCTGKSLATGMSCEFQSPDNRKARLYFLSYSDPAVLILRLLACSKRVTHSSESPLARFSCELPLDCIHLINSSHSLIHNPYIIPT